MKQHAGLDVSLKEISICVVDIDGAVLVRGTLPTEPQAVASFLALSQTFTQPKSILFPDTVIQRVPQTA